MGIAPDLCTIDRMITVLKVDIVNAGKDWKLALDRPLLLVHVLEGVDSHPGG